jgi:hypothetical protein
MMLHERTELVIDFPRIPGPSESAHCTPPGLVRENLNMRAFAEAYPDRQFVQQLVALLTWWFPRQPLRRYGPVHPWQGATMMLRLRLNVASIYVLIAPMDV